jgi:hypothetical protein
MRVASIGEIKTQPVGGNKYEVSLHLVAGDSSQFPKFSGTKRDDQHKLSPNVQARLQRQVRQMGEALHRAQIPSAAQAEKLHARFHYDELLDLVARSHYRHFEFVKAGPSLVMGALRLRSATLGACLLDNRTNVDRVLTGAKRWACGIFDAKLEGNALYVGTVGGGRHDLALMPEMLPLLWWPLPDEILRDVLFGRVMVVTLYNPAHFWEGLKSRGFQLAWEKGQREPRASRKLNKGTMELRHFGLYHSLISRHLMTQASVLEMVDRMLTAATEIPRTGPIRVEMRPPRFVRDPGLKM